MLKFVLLMMVAFAGTVYAGVEEKIEQANRNLWTRFISPYNIIYDYAGSNGEVILPTPEECEKNIPNALGWWTPIEDAGFFNGLYLIAAVERYEQDPTPENKEKAKRIASGLYKAQEVAKVPGFISRGVGSDGKCHYIASSNDQSFPWIMGLWRYLTSSIPTAEEKAEGIAKVRRHVEALEKLNWVLVGEKPNFDRGWWLGDGYTNAVHISMATLAMYDLTGEKRWKELHDNLLTEDRKPRMRRIDHIARGPEKVEDWSAWFLSGCQYAVRVFFDRATDPELKSKYKESLNNSAAKAAKVIGCYKRFDPSKERVFNPDWHQMMPPWKEQNNGTEASALALEQLKVWNKANPAVAQDKASVKPAMAASWIVALSEDKSLLEANLPEIINAINHFDYDKLHYAAFFFAENTAYTLRKYGYLPLKK